MNRFERHPRLTTALLLGAMMAALLALTEWALTPPDAGATALSARSLPVREWTPGTTYRFEPPPARQGDGPVSATYEAVIDDQGFIAAPQHHDAPDKRILFLGGSTTECLYVLPEARFPARAGALLGMQVDLKINGINGGKSGNNSMHSLAAFLAKGIPAKPDIVVMMHNINDLIIYQQFESYWTIPDDRYIVAVDTPSLFRVARQVRDALLPYTYRAVRRGLDILIADARAAEARRDIGRGPEHFRASLESFVRVARAWGVEPVLMTQATLSPDSLGDRGEDAYLDPAALARADMDSDRYLSHHARFNQIVRGVAGAEGVTLVDLAARADWSESDLYDGLHFTDAGSEKAARMIADALGPLLQGTAR